MLATEDSGMMYIGPRFRDLIAKRRIDLGLKKIDLARRLGVAHTTVSRWEQGVCVPDQQTLARLARALDLPLRTLLESLPPPSDASLLRSVLREMPPYDPPRERENYQRLKRCLELHSEQTRRCLDELNRREDQSEIRHFLREVHTRSRLELLFTLAALTFSRPTDGAPARLHLPWPVVHERSGRPEGGRKWPLLITADRTTLLFNAPLLTFDGIFTPDVLVGPPGEPWRVIEIDGEGHDPVENARKEKALALRLDRLQEADIAADDFPHLLREETRPRRRSA